MLLEHPVWSFAMAATAVFFAAGFLSRRAWVRAAQLLLLFVAVPLFAAFAAGDCASAAPGCGRGCPGESGDLNCEGTTGDYQAAVPVEKVEASDEQGNAVDVSGSSVVGSVKAATPATEIEQNPFLSGGGGCGQKK